MQKEASRIFPDGQQVLSEKVYQALLDEILFDKLPKRGPLSVVSISERLGVSRTPVHEAILLLERDGLLVRRPNQRPIPRIFTKEDIHEIYEIRKLMEGESAARSAGRVELPTLVGLQEDMEKLRGVADEEAWCIAWTEHDDRFHQTIADNCGMPRLRSDICRYRTLHRVLNRSFPSKRDLAEAFKQHQSILQALESRDAEQARQSMIEHLHTWQRYFVKHFPNPDNHRHT